MEHKGTQPLETKHLLLRRFQIKDSQAMFANWSSDALVTKYLRWPPHENCMVTQEVLKAWITQYDEPSFYQWGITIKSLGDEVIGSIGVVQQNEDLNIVHIGYCIGRKFWHQEITSEALSALVHFFFTSVKANRIESQHDPKNPNSGKVMLKCGFTYEGTLRAADYNNQGIVDAAIYSILAKEYKER